MLGGGLPSSPVFRIALAFGGRTGIGFSNPQPIVYAGFAVTNDVYRLFVTRDGGVNWTELSSPPHDPGQLSFNNVITVGPYNSDEVYIGQIAFYQSLDGGQSQIQIVFVANDGGMHPRSLRFKWCRNMGSPFQGARHRPVGSDRPRPE
ncbi:MAG TPA: hypothetical protein VHN11_17680 [Xanthobacteraceae bacterium]|nr:hypothetical protein [Xanthobacteraceae bacterium]